MAEAEYEPEFIIASPGELESAIRHCYKTLTDNIQTDEIRGHLFSNGILSTKEKQHVDKVGETKGSVWQAEQLLDYLLEKPDEKRLVRFSDCLRKYQPTAYSLVKATVDGIRKGEIEPHRKGLIYCVHHLEKEIELFCEPCHTPVCLVCIATEHSGHKCQTIQATLDKMVPQWEDNIKYIDQRLEAVNKSTGEVEKKIEETQSDFQRCVNQVAKQAEARIAEIKAMQKQMTDDLRTREKGGIEKLEKVRRDLGEKKREGEGVRGAVRTSLDRAQLASLMTELLGLGQKMEAVRKWEEEEEVKVEVEVPVIEGGDKEMDASMKAELLGQVIYNPVTFLLMLGSGFKKAVTSRVWDVEAKEYLNKKFKQVKEIQLAGSCIRITPIKHHIWAPLYIANSIQIYNRSCELVRTIKIRNPVSVEEASNGDVFIACCDGPGLYVTTGINQTPDLITEGNFLDVCPYNGKMYALNYGEKTIQEYLCDNSNKWSLQKSVPVHDLEVGDTLIVAQSGYYVTACDKHSIHHYSAAGECLQTFTDSLEYPSLCGIDSNSNIIVANKKSINAVHCVTGKVVALKQLKTQDVNSFYDVRLDTEGSVWLLYQNSAHKFCISKYEVY